MPLILVGPKKYQWRTEVDDFTIAGLLPKFETNSIINIIIFIIVITPPTLYILSWNLAEVNVAIYTFRVDKPKVPVKSWGMMELINHFHLKLLDLYLNQKPYFIIIISIINEVKNKNH